MNDWKQCRVKDIASPLKNSLVGGPFGSNLGVRDYVSIGIPVIRGQNMGAGRWVEGDFAFVTKEKAQSLFPNLARPDDLIFTQRGTLGQVALLPQKPYNLYLISQSQMKLTVDREKADNLFIYYYFSLPEQKEYFERVAIRAGVPHTNLQILRDTPIILPPLTVQQAIARLLGALDDKIELNRCMNRTLESLAQAIFKSWFVDFDPVVAKSEGRQPYGMNLETAAFFPSELRETNEGPIPTGWEYIPIGKLMTNFDSRRVPLSGAQRVQRQGIYPYYGAASIMDYIDDYLFDGIYVLVGEDGSVTDDIGMAVTQYVWGKFWVNNHAHILQGRNSVSTEHLLLHFKNEPINPYVTGAVQPKLNQTNMNSMPFLMPSKEVADLFSRTISPWFALLRAKTEESRTLSTLRDTLLPKLLSGEIRLPQAERIVGEAT
jgi:type I restriction enzyme, S subunit